MKIFLLEMFITENIPNLLAYAQSRIPAYLCWHIWPPSHDPMTLFYFLSTRKSTCLVPYSYNRRIWVKCLGHICLGVQPTNRSPLPLHKLRTGDLFTDMDETWYQYGYVTTWPIQFRAKLLIHSQTSTAAQLKFVLYWILLPNNDIWWIRD